MSTIAELRVPVDEFALRETLTAVPDVEVEVERVVAYGDDAVMPFFWASGGDLDAFEEALEGDPTVDNVCRLSRLEDGRFYQMEWVDFVHLIVVTITQQDSTILNAHASEKEWHLRIIFPDRDALSATYDSCRGQELDVEIERVYEISETKRYGQYGLTNSQYETLAEALELGYYNVPRDVTLNELADELGITHQSLSERLRRGHGNLVENALTVNFSDEPKKK